MSEDKSQQLSLREQRYAASVLLDCASLFFRLRDRMPIAYMATFLRVAATQGLTVAELASRRSVSGAVMSRHLGELGGHILRYGAEIAGREQRFIAHPNTWLSQGRWADESVTPITGTIDANGDQVRPPPDRPPPANAHAARAQFYVERLKAHGGAQ